MLFSHGSGQQQIDDHKKFRRIAGNFNGHGKLVFILAGAVCVVWEFAPVQTYACVGLYLFSTVSSSWLARKHKKPKNLLFSGYKKIAFVILRDNLILRSVALVHNNRMLLIYQKVLFTQLAQTDTQPESSSPTAALRKHHNHGPCPPPPLPPPMAGRHRFRRNARVLCIMVDACCAHFALIPAARGVYHTIF